jgi:hypothetical protein
MELNLDWMINGLLLVGLSRLIQVLSKNWLWFFISSIMLKLLYPKIPRISLQISRLIL